jgi:peptidoglycan/xylan/chitin deacetylase (PgdA/CDA1 family)
MDEAALRERRAAHDHRVRRRRRIGLTGVLVVALGVVASLAAGGDGQRGAATSPRPDGAPQPAGQRGAPPRTVASRTADASPGSRRPAGLATLPPVAALPGAHRAPHEPVPILMYHVIGTRGPLTTNPGLWVAPADFAAQVRALKGARYHAVALQDVWNAWRRHGKLPSNPVVLSFDDGYAGQVRDALPILAAARWPGVLNLEVHNLADMGGTKAVKRLVAAGWEIDAHTISHPDLTTLGPAALRDQVAGSRARLRRLFGVPVSFFCYPSGRYDAAVIAAVKAAGYLGATTTALGWATPASDAFTLPRVRVDGAMSPEAVLQRLRDTRPVA